MNTLSHPTKLYLGGLVLAVAGVYASTANAAPGGASVQGSAETIRMAQGHAGGPMRVGMGGSMGGSMGGPMLDGMLPRLLDRVKATPEQLVQIKTIMDNSAADIRTQREAGRALREQAMALFTQATVDANAVEALRQKQMAVHDASSKRMSLALLEISRVLTPEQRRQMAEQMKQRGEMMQRHQRERQGLDAPKS